MPAAARSKLCSSVSAWLGVFASIAMSSASVGSLVRSGNYCCSSMRVASIEENKTAIER